MAWKLYDYIDNRENNAIKAWTHSLQRVQRAKINSKLDMLAIAGTDLPTGLLSDTKLPHIKEIVIKGQVALRLLVCKGPIQKNEEFTLLFGAQEKDRQYIPRDALERAETRRQEIIEAEQQRKEIIEGGKRLKTPNSRRCIHERVA